MALKIEPRTIRLYEFELQLLDKLQSATGKTEEEILLGYIRLGLMKERHDELTYDKLKKEAALALLEAEAEEAYRVPADTRQKPKSRRNSQNDETPGTTDQPQQSSPQFAKGASELEIQFLNLAQQFALSEVAIDQIKPSESYLMRGRKQVRAITILSINEDNSVQYQLYNAPEQKTHTVQAKSLLNNLRGPISPLMLEKLAAELAE
jgi:hypothetical protein